MDSKLIGETCHKGRSAYLLQYDVYHKYNKQPSESTFKFEGYQLIDKETGFYFYGKTKGLWFIDYGKVLDDGTKRFEYIANETFDYSFDKSNCSTKKITKSKSTNATQKTTSNNKNNTNKLVKEKLLELKKLFDEGLITKDVYEKKQLELLE